jgi:hypothetical protein
MLRSREFANSKRELVENAKPDVEALIPNLVPPVLLLVEGHEDGLGSVGRSALSVLHRE